MFLEADYTSRTRASLVNKQDSENIHELKLVYYEDSGGYESG